MKVVEVGLNKTGTTTLGVCLRHWGYNHISCNKEAFELWRDGQTDSVVTMVANYDSFEDWPWPLIYKQIDQAFPGSKFILTTRSSAETWYRSLCKHAERTGPTEYRKHVYGYDMPQGHKDEHIGIYERHNAAVRLYFRDRPEDLLEVCWEDGDEWEGLAKFLGNKQPAIPFPHANRAHSLSSRINKHLTSLSGSGFV